MFSRMRYSFSIGKLANKTPKQKHIPHRTCIVCRLKIDKRRVTRIVRTPEGEVLVDLTGKRNGRGGYLCDNIECWNKAINSKILDRALKAEISESDKLALAASLPGSSQ